MELLLIRSCTSIYIFLDLGFIPNEYTSSTIDFGLWSFESNTGSCVSHQEAHHTYSWAVAELEDSVWSWFANGDVSWSASRVFGVMGVLFGGVSLVRRIGIAYYLLSLLLISSL